MKFPLNKTVATALASALLCLGLAGCATQTASVEESTDDQNNTEAVAATSIIDSSGKTVEIPEDLSSIADLWPAHNQIMMALGETDKIIATTTATTGNAWVKKVYPDLAELPSFKTNEVDVEALVAAGAQFGFASSEEAISTMENADIPAAYVTYGTYDELIDVMQTTASIFGSEAVERANAYEDYLEEAKQNVASKVEDIDKKSVLYVNEYNVTYGQDTIVNEWIEAAGAENAYQEQGSGEIGAEAIFALDPDVIIVSNREKYDEFTTSESTSQLRAIREGNIFVAPTGTFSWSQYGVETALMFQWAAQNIYPDQMSDLNLVDEVQDFYETFFDYDLTADDAQRIIDGLDPSDNE